MRVDIDQAKQLLLDGKLVAFPTETVYGLWAIATNVDAVESVYTIKSRPKDNPLICHFASASQIMQYTSRIPNYRDVLVSHFSPGAVSYLLSCGDDRLHPATRWSDKVLCRVPNHPLALQLLEQLDQPLVWPSANPSWQPSATNASMVEDYFGDEVAVIDGGSSWIGLESTIIDCTQHDRVVIHRPGQVWVTDIQQILDRSGHRVVVELATDIHSFSKTIYRLYSPQTMIFKIAQWNPIHDRGDIAIIWPTELLEQIHTTELTHRIDLWSVYTPAIIAHNLYHKLHELDWLWVRHVYLLMWKLGDSSIEQALSNRLEKIGEWRE